MNRLLNEPVVIATAIRSVILASVSFGLSWTPEQIASVMLSVEAVLTVLTRALVTPNQLAESRVAAGFGPTVKRNDNIRSGLTFNRGRKPDDMEDAP